MSEEAVELVKYVGGGAIVPTEHFVPSIEDTKFTSPSGLCMSPMGCLMVSDHKHRGIFVIEGGRTHALATRDVSSKVQGISDPEVVSGGGDVLDIQGISHESSENEKLKKDEMEQQKEETSQKSTELEIHNPFGIACLEDGTTLVADMHDNTIKKIRHGHVSIFAGTGKRGGMDGKFCDSSFDKPKCLCLTPRGDLLVSEVGSHRIRLLIMEYGGVVVTVAGEGPKGYKEGDAALARFSHPSGLCCVRLDPSLMYLTYRPTPKDCSDSDQSSSEGEKDKLPKLPGISKSSAPMELMSEFEDEINKYDDMLIFVSDTHNHRVRMIHNGTVSNVAGNGSPGLADGPGNLAQFDHPMNICMAFHAVLVADNRNDRIRRIDLDSDLVSTICVLNPSAVVPSLLFSPSQEDDEVEDLIIRRPSVMALNEAGELFVASEFENHAEVHQLLRFKPPYGLPERGHLLSTQERLCTDEAQSEAQKSANEETPHPSTSAQVGDNLQHQLQGLHDFSFGRAASSGHIRMLIARERSKSVDCGIASISSQSSSSEENSGSPHERTMLLHDFGPETEPMPNEKPWGIVSKLSRMLSLDENKMMHHMDSLLSRFGFKSSVEQDNHSKKQTTEQNEDPKIAPIAPHQDASAQKSRENPKTPTKGSESKPKKVKGKLAAEDSDVDSDEIVTF